MKSWIVFVSLWAIAYAMPDPSPPISPPACSVFVCPPPPPEPIPPLEPKEGLITALLEFMDGINDGANTLVGKTFADHVFEITQLVNTVGITGDVCSVLRRNKQLADEFWKIILDLISDLAWKIQKKLVAISIIYEDNLGLIADNPSVQDDLRAIHGLQLAGQGKAVPIVLGVKAEFDQTIARFDLQTRYLHSVAIRSNNPQGAQQQWVALYQQTVASLGATMEKYYSQTQVVAVATQNQLKVIVARLLSAIIAADTQILS